MQHLIFLTVLFIIGISLLVREAAFWLANKINGERNLELHIALTCLAVVLIVTVFVILLTGHIKV